MEANTCSLRAIRVAAVVEAIAIEAKLLWVAE